MVFSKKPIHFIITMLVATAPFFGFANNTDTLPVKHEIATIVSEVKPLSEAELEKVERKEFINHHLMDSHDFTLFSDKETGEHYGFSLPVILLDNGLQIFSSSEFHHGQSVAENNGNYYVLHHEKIYKTDEKGTLIEGHEGHPENVRPIDFSITKNVLGIIGVAIFMFFLFTNLAKSFVKNGGISTGFARIFEPLVIYIRDEIAIPNIGEKAHKKYMSYLLTVFFFIFFLNILGLMPFGFNVTGNITITASLALLTYLITTFSSNKHYWSHMLWMPGVPILLKPFLALIELLGTIIKPFSLMIRLYANMLAGHVVLMSIIALMFVFKSWIGSPLSFLLAFSLSILEILVAFLQAYIFTMLTSLYFGAANEEHHHEEAHH